MTIHEEIKTRIEAALSPDHLEVINESHKHAGHAGDDGSGQTHFKLMVVSAHFEGQSRVQRQQGINTIIAPLFDQGLHALSMRLLTLGEYRKE